MATSAPPSPGRPSLREASLFSVAWYLSVLGGSSLLAVSAVVLAGSSLARAGPELFMTALMLLILELRPVLPRGRHDPEGVVVSAAFVIAILVLWGLWPAVLVFSIATFASELRKRKPLWKVAFNVGQFDLSVAAAWLVMVAAGRMPSLEQPLEDLTGGDLLWVAGMWVAYWLTNNLLVSAASAHASSFRTAFFDDFGYYAAVTFGTLSLTPIIVVMAQHAWVMLPLILVPLALVHRTAQMAQEKEQQAATDPLTGLPNRSHLQTLITERLEGRPHDGRPCALVLLDLDHFKEVNDTLGHPVGDQLLQYFADRLRDCVGPGDIVARLGGDEFAVVLDGADETKAREVTERIRLALTRPMMHAGMLLDVEASMGLALYPEHGTDADQLLRAADVAMYVAKESRTGMVTYSAERDRNSADRLTLIGELRRALDDGELALHYQPKVSMLNGELIGFEALVRWHSPARGFVPPDEFVPLAERSGIMHLLTNQVVTLALEQLARWRQAGLHVPVAVNISVTDLTALTGARLTNLVASSLRRHGLPAGMLQLELTERVVAQQTDELDLVLVDLDRMGVTLSLDDFGTGYSSLLRLQSLPVDEIKIDRAFVSRIGEGPSAVGIVQSVIDLAHALGMPVVAEGVETQTEWDVLRSLGCDGAQGWFIARPMPAERATTWMRDRMQAAGELPAGESAR